MKHKLFITIIALTLMLFVCTAYGGGEESNLPLYPAETEHTLDTYEIGVETIVPADNMEFIFENTMMPDNTISTKGIFVVYPDYQVISINVKFVIVNKNKRIVKIVPILNQSNPDNAMKFISTYPYSPDYELCTFHIEVILNYLGEDEEEEVFYDEERSVV